MHLYSFVTTALAISYFVGGCHTPKQAQGTTPVDFKRKTILHISQTADYCGGAAPPKQLLETLKTPKPLAETPIFLKIYDANLVAQPLIKQYTTDINGVVEVELEAGKYALVMEDKYNSPAQNPRLAAFTKSPRCQTWRNTPDCTFEIVSGKSETLTLSVHKSCNPCLPPRP